MKVSEGEVLTKWVLILVASKAENAFMPVIDHLET